MKKIIISVISLVMILSLSAAVSAEESSDFISVEDAYALMDAETNNALLAAETEIEGDNATLSAAKSGMDASISYTRVAVTRNKQIVDTFNGVPAYYNPVVSGSPYQCSEYIKRYYDTVYGKSLKGYKITTSPKPGDYIYATKEQRGKSYGHYAVIKSVSDNKLTLIEQNWAWRNGGTVYTAVNRVIPYGGEYAGTYTVHTPVVGASNSNDGSTGAQGFSDVPSSYWAYQAINTLVEKGIVNGIGGNKFSPEGTVTRAQFVKMLGEASGNNVPNYTTQHFKDVSSKHWAYTYVNWAKVNNVVSGKTATSFGPDEKITRQELAQMMYNYAIYKGINISPVNDTINFTDSKKIGSWAKEAVTAMQRAGVINGNPNGSFDPLSSATRSQAATMIYNLQYN